MAKRKKVAKAHYVDNALFLEEMIENSLYKRLIKNNVNRGGTLTSHPGGYITNLKDLDC